MTKLKNKKIRVIIILFVSVVLVLSIVIPTIVNVPQSKKSSNILYDITGVSIGYVNVSNYAAISNISLSKVYTSNPFDISLNFPTNFSLKFIYITTPHFRVNQFLFKYNDYYFNGSGQGSFIGSTASTCASLNIIVYSSISSFSGVLSIHLVGNVPPTVIY
jgi:hypothetical protein